MAKKQATTTQLTQCSGCAYWRGDPKLPEGVGHCHRHPPAVFYATDGAGQVRNHTGFPQVKEIDFCGEFKRYI